MTARRRFVAATVGPPAPPVNITAGVGKELARISIVVCFGPVGKSLVLG